MKLLKVTLALALILSAMPMIAVADQHGEKGMGMEGEMPPMGPPEEMKMCADMIGEWKFVGEWRMDPSQEWTDTEADVEISYILDSALVRMDYISDMMGMKMHGISMLAFNRHTNTWQQLWTDNMGAAISLYTGEVTEEKQVFSGTDLMNGQKIHSRITSYDITDDTFKWKMEHSMDGKEWFVAMKGTYTKK